MNTEDARNMGREIGEYWDEEPLIQSAEWANDHMPELRAMAGFSDSGYGTYNMVPEDADEDELQWNLEELLEAFWEGFLETYIG